ncbi:putative BYS1 domain protein [Podospora didyma]|uniref:BYS1 domain protein n=1 Tax=Podospora didyma TaxID=330526 RepID=A0AAE0K5V6_9PEZI|nr:putative BYS1 domain protein [Podospora didyma]
MLNKLTILLAATAAPANVLAIGAAVIVNRCPFPVTAWSVGSAITGPFSIPATTGVWNEGFLHDALTGGRAIKITRSPDGLYTGAPQTIFAYTLDEPRVWFDLSDVFGDAFAGNKVIERSSDAGCANPAIIWPTGVPPAGSQVKVCNANQDVTLTLCAA